MAAIERGGCEGVRPMKERLTLADRGLNRDMVRRKDHRGACVRESDLLLPVQVVEQNPGKAVLY